MIAGSSAINRKEVRAQIKYHVIYRHREQHSISVMCRFFSVSRSGYYDFVKRLGIPGRNAELAEADELINRYIYFYNHERIQLKTGVAPLTLRHSA